MAVSHDAAHEPPLDPHHAAAAYVQSLLQGNPPNGVPPEAFAERADLIRSLHDIHAAHGTDGVRQFFQEYTKRHPAEAWLASADVTQPRGWRIYTLADAYQLRPRQVSVMQGMFPLPSLSMLYGPPGTLKSLLLADMAVCVAAGMVWLPPPPNTSGQGKVTMPMTVLWADFDNGAHLTHERMEAVARDRDLPETTPIRYVSMPSPWLDASTWAGLQVLRECIQVEGATLVSIDNLVAVKGRVDENSAEMGTVMGHLRRLTEDTGIAVILVHHQRKDSGVTSRAGDRVRGHSSIEAALDLALLVEREPHSDSLTLRSTKERGVSVPPFGAILAYTHKPGTTELETARFFGVEVKDIVSDRAIETAVLETVKATPQIIKKDLVAQVKADLPKVGENRVAGIIGRLLQHKRLQTTRGEGTTLHYTVL
jgi:hypothetical protein